MNARLEDPVDPVQFARALADPTRQALMRHCTASWRSVGEIARQLEIRQPSVSHHIAILKEAGLLNMQPRGRQTFYRLDQDQIAIGCGTLILQFAPEVVAGSN